MMTLHGQASGLLNGWIYLAVEFIRIMAIVLAVSGIAILAQTLAQPRLSAARVRMLALARVRNTSSSQ
jgi:hypothetical protein